MVFLGYLVWALGGCDAAGDTGATPDFIPRGELKLVPNAAIVTYYEASWTTEVSGPTRLEIDDGDEPLFVTDWFTGTDVLHVPVLGVWPSHTFTARLVDEEGGLIARETFTTEAGPTDLSRMTVSGEATWEGYLLTEIATSDVQTVMILAPSGKPVWYWQLTGNYVVRTLLRRDGLGVWVLGMPGFTIGVRGWIGSVAWDGTMLMDLTPVGHDGEGATHDIYELEDGRLVFIAPDTRNVDGVDYAGDTIYALETDGAETALWSFWDEFAPDDTVVAPLSWTHANALRWNNDRQTLWVGSRDLNMLVELDPKLWRMVNQLGGVEPTFHLAPGTVPPKGQHQFDFRHSRLAMHDNRDATVGTRLAIYDLDFSEQLPSAEETFEYVPEPTIYDFVMGDVTWLDDERLITTWSTTGILEERHLDGDAPWSITLDLGSVFPYTQHVDALPGCLPVSVD